MLISAIIAVSAVILGLVIALIRQIHQTSKIRKSLADLQEKVRKDRNVVELPLATTKQIVYELVRRPNIKFILLLPHGDKNTEMAVEIHSSNIPLPMCLGMLKATYQGVIDTLRNRGGDGEEE